MSFIQCKSEDDVEIQMQKLKLKHGFVTEDHRIYTEILLSDDACYMFVNSETFMHLYNLQEMLEQLHCGLRECPFTEIENRSKELTAYFKKAMQSIKYRPLVKVKK